MHMVTGGLVIAAVVCWEGGRGRKDVRQVKVLNEEARKVGADTAAVDAVVAPY